MRFDLSDTQQLLKDSARKCLQSECPITKVRRLVESDTPYDAALWQTIAEQGWTGIRFAEAYDGLGLGMVEVAAIMEEMGRALLPAPYTATVLMAGTLLDRAGNDAQKRQYLAPICRGEARATLAWLEADASWNPAHVRMDAVNSGDGLVLRGAKRFVPDAVAADFFICAGRVGGELGLVIVAAGSPGLHLTAMPALDLTRPLYAVDFDGVAVSRENILAVGEPAQAALEDMTDVATVGLTAEMVGGMQRVLEIAVDYAKTRQQFGKPIGQFQAVQHMCADMLVLLESARSAAYYAAYELNERLPEARLAVSVAKAYLSDAYREVGNRGIQVHGGMGFTWENDVHLYYRRAKASEILFGDAAYHRERIARMVIDAKGASA